MITCECQWRPHYEVIISTYMSFTPVSTTIRGLEVVHYQQEGGGADSSHTNVGNILDQWDVILLPFNCESWINAIYFTVEPDDRAFQYTLVSSTEQHSRERSHRQRLANSID